MNLEIIFDHKKIILISLGLGIITVSFISFAWMGILISIFIFCIFAFGDKFPIFFFIAAFLVITSDISETLRIIINICGIIYLSYKFIRVYDFEFAYYKKIPRIVEYYIIFAVFSLIISTVFSAQPLTGLLEILRLIGFIIIIYFFYSFINKKEDANLYLFSLLTAGVIIALTILYFFLSFGSSIFLLETQGLAHEGGCIKNVAAAGGIFSITIPLNLALLFDIKINAGRKKIFFWVTLIIQTIALLLTSSRSAYLAVFISSVFITAKLNFKIFKKIVISFIGISSAILLLFPKIIDIFGTFIRAGRILENTRYYLWDIAAGIFKDYPVFGCGPGMFKFYMYRHLPVMLGSWDENQIYWVYQNAGAGHAHNFFLYRASETGILGLFAAILLPVIFFYLSIKVLKVVKENKYWNIILTAIIGSGIGLFARSFFESTGLFTNGWITRDLPFWILLIIIIFLYENLIVLKKDIQEI